VLQIEQSNGGVCNEMSAAPTASCDCAPSVSVCEVFGGLAAVSFGFLLESVLFLRSPMECNDRIPPISSEKHVLQLKRLFRTFNFESDDCMFRVFRGGC
jgi:hypothetical protein